MKRNIVIIGAGIVGTLLARELAHETETQVTVLDRAPEGQLPGSTGHAPGFVGLYNEDETHVPLAVESARMYDSFPSAFTRVGAYDVADTEAGAEGLRARLNAARSCGLDVTEVSVAEAARCAPALIDPERIIYAIHSSGDGATDDAAALVAEVRADARRLGARFVYGVEVREVSTGAGEHVIEVNGELFRADDIVLAGGIWGGVLSGLVGQELPLVPVGHPYIYSASQSRQVGGPLVRFREHAIYARAHGDRIGMGCYAHDPFDASVSASGTIAEVDWPAELFDPIVEREIAVLPESARFEPQRRLNGVFAMTPDGRPYIGPLASATGIWVAQAIWVTHAGGAVRLLADMIRSGEGDGGLFSPTRFAGGDLVELRRRALELY